MSISIKVLTLGIAQTNCYIVGDTETKAAVVVDPVDAAPLLFKTAQDAGWTIKLMLATHGHYDHILAAAELKELTGAPFYIHRNTPQLAGFADDPFIAQIFPPIPKPDRRLLDETEHLELDSLRFETLFTPGHSPDHVCFFMREHNLLFGGDCLFAGSIGRTDLPYGDHATLMNSIFDKLIPLGDSVHVLPGHMQPTTIERERRTNPFLQQR
jgi:hydroxyacylglutathione hydrolase